jgi:hypothetical protein
MHDMSRRSGERRSAGARRWAWIGGVAGALAVSGALLAVLYERGGREPAGGDGMSGGATEQVDEEFGRTKWRHDFPDSYSGPVWITVESPDSRVRDVTINWGVWEKRFTHDGTEPASYRFSKDPGPSVALTVKVEPGAKVTFSSGTPPADAEDINAGWTKN